ncbi:hypothetical protein EV401DRAFT_2011059 [Pisolithus croceorrhizus]|nr:hypothetical protein EV401DRAFT_2011059 [Pisolithus croceorrhizus]
MCCLNTAGICASLGLLAVTSPPTYVFNQTQSRQGPSPFTGVFSYPLSNLIYSDEPSDLRTKGYPFRFSSFPQPPHFGGAPPNCWECHSVAHERYTND